MAPSGIEDVAVVRGIYEAFGHADLARIAELVAPDVTIYQTPALPWGGSHEGHQGLLHFLSTLTAHLDSTPVTEHLIADGAGVVVQVGRTRGTVRATGAAFDVTEAHVWTVRDGRVVRFEAYLDTASLLDALDSASAASPGAVPQFTGG